MSMYTVCGRVFYGNDLYHGLGKGSGRGRPKGSRNGYISPGAAYMKNYQVVGEKAEGGQDVARRQQSSGGIIKKDGTRLRASNAVSSGVSSRKVDNAPTRTTRTKAPQGHGAAAATARGRELMTNLDAGKPYNMRSDPYSGRGAAANEPDGYNMHSDPYENTQGTAAENTHSESWWETLGRGLSGVASRIKNMAVRAIDTGKKAFNDARNWVSNALAPVGRLAKTAYNAAAKWVGDRAKDLDRWWNGYDTSTANQLGEITTTHTKGVRENIQDAAGAAARNVTNAGHAAENAVLGTPTYNMHGDPYGDPQYSGRSGGVFGRGGVVDQGVSTARDLANQYVAQPVGQFVNDRAGDLDRFWNGYDEQRANQLGDITTTHVNGVGDNLANAGRTVENAVLGTPTQYDMHSDPYGDPQYTGRSGGVFGRGGVVDQAGQLANQGVDWANQNVVQPAGRLWNQGVDWANQNVVQPGVNLGRHIVNAPPALNAAPASSNAGDNFNEAARSVSSSDLAQEAVARGVPQATVDQLSQQYAYGLISEAALEQRLRDLAGYR